MMKKYICSVCGYIYDEAKGIPDANIAPGTNWEKLPPGWVCPLCGAAKTEFKELTPASGQNAQKPGSDDSKKTAVSKIPADRKELSALELSALCSNLARGCEKQYMPDEMSLFTELADYFKNAAQPPASPDYKKLLELIEKDLEEMLPAAKGISTDAGDRGALRALVWNEKVTRILKSILTRYITEGEAMLKNTGIYVCTICGFIFIGDTPPDVCPVCKVPNWKFEKIEGRRS